MMVHSFLNNICYIILFCPKFNINIVSKLLIQSNNLEFKYGDKDSSSGIMLEKEGGRT